MARRHHLRLGTSKHQHFRNGLPALRFRAFSPHGARYASTQGKSWNRVLATAGIRSFRRNVRIPPLRGNRLDATPTGHWSITAWALRTPVAPPRKAAMGVQTDKGRSRTARSESRCKFACSSCPPSHRQMLVGRIVGGFCGQSWEFVALAPNQPSSHGGKPAAVRFHVQQASQFPVGPKRDARPILAGLAATCPRRAGTESHSRCWQGRLGSPFMTGLHLACNSL